MTPESAPGMQMHRDRIIAAMGHAAVTVPVLGSVVPLIIWATQRRRSRLVAFQALQAAVYQMTLILAGLMYVVSNLCVYLGMIASVVAILVASDLTMPGGPQPGVTEVPFEALAPASLGLLGFLVLYLLAVATGLSYIGYGLYGAVANLQGKDFRYAVIGPRLERYLQQT